MILFKNVAGFFGILKNFEGQLHLTEKFTVLHIFREDPVDNFSPKSELKRKEKIITWNKRRGKG